MFFSVFTESLRAPFKDPEWLPKILVGGLLDLGLVLIAYWGLSTGSFTPVFFVLVPVGLFLKLVAWGYLYRIFVDGLNGAKWAGLPSWRDWKPFCIVGFWLFIIVLGYAFFAVAGLFALLALLGGTPTSKEPEGVAILAPSLLATFAVLSGFFPIAFARLAAQGKVWAAFDPGALLRDIRQVVRADYIQSCFTFFFFWLAGNLVLSTLPYIGLPLVSIYLFYVIAVFAQVFGRLIGVEGQRARNSERF